MPIYARLQYPSLYSHWSENKRTVANPDSNLYISYNTPFVDYSKYLTISPRVEPADILTLTIIPSVFY